FVSLSILLDILPLLSSLVFFLLLPRPPTSTLFPYTTLFRSVVQKIRKNDTSNRGPSAKYAHVPWRAQKSPQTREARWLVSPLLTDRKSTRLNSSHVSISYAVFCLKKKIAATKF